MIVVDPRFTRTAAVADLHCQIRAGSDIAFLGASFRYAIGNNRIAKDYLVNFTNAAFIVKPGFQLPGDTDVRFLRFMPRRKAMISPHGIMRAQEEVEELTHRIHQAEALRPLQAAGKSRVRSIAAESQLRVQLLRKHYSRYTPEMVERITGIPKEQFLKAADLYTSIRKDGDMKKASTIIYAVGWTQHSFGTQIIRTAAILQLVLGNVGRAGGGVNALRGHSTFRAPPIWPGFSTLCPAI